MYDCATRRTHLNAYFNQQQNSGIDISRDDIFPPFDSLSVLSFNFRPLFYFLSPNILLFSNPAVLLVLRNFAIRFDSAFMGFSETLITGRSSQRTQNLQSSLLRYFSTIFRMAFSILKLKFPKKAKNGFSVRPRETRTTRITYYQRRRQSRLL